MIDNPSVAKQISDLMMDTFSRLTESCQTVRSQCSEQEYKAYMKSTSGIAHSIVFEVMEPLYKKHPNLKPHNWDDDRNLQQLTQSDGC
jgi:hypothetical protein